MYPENQIECDFHHSVFIFSERFSDELLFSACGKVNGFQKILKVFSLVIDLTEFSAGSKRITK